MANSQELGILGEIPKEKEQELTPYVAPQSTGVVSGVPNFLGFLGNELQNIPKAKENLQTQKDNQSIGESNRLIGQYNKSSLAQNRYDQIYRIGANNPAFQTNPQVIKTLQGLEKETGIPIPRDEQGNIVWGALQKSREISELSDKEKEAIYQLPPGPQREARLKAANIIADPSTIDAPQQFAQKDLMSAQTAMKQAITNLARGKKENDLGVYTSDDLLSTAELYRPQLTQLAASSGTTFDDYVLGINRNLINQSAENIGRKYILDNQHDSQSTAKVAKMVADTQAATTLADVRKAQTALTGVKIETLPKESQARINKMVADTSQAYAKTAELNKASQVLTTKLANGYYASPKELSGLKGNVGSVVASLTSQYNALLRQRGIDDPNGEWTTDQQDLLEKVSGDLDAARQRAEVIKSPDFADAEKINTAKSILGNSSVKSGTNSFNSALQLAGKKKGDVMGLKVDGKIQNAVYMGPGKWRNVNTNQDITDQKLIDALDAGRAKYTSN